MGFQVGSSSGAAIGETRAVVDGSGSPGMPRQAALEIPVQGVALIVVEQEIAVRWRREIGQSPGQRAFTLGTLPRVDDRQISALEEPRGAETELLAADPCARNGHREEYVRIAE